MKSTFKIWETNRNLHIEFLEQFSLEQLNKTPSGFTNNLIWNIGHIIATQQGLIYRLSGLPVTISKEFHNKYKIGTFPTKPATQEEVDEIKSLLLCHIQQTRDDYEDGKFLNFKEYVTSIGFHLSSIEEAISFNNYHEAIHLGFMINIKKFI
ncbi:DinB family protein [Flavobacterium petrolei]|uniref:DinB family protein n=1 Tax=Flavobacterium petrolei TaxID=2259594 RepID=A0A482TF33_9FLAO|nr:DinB family protein [Flavobacterium petrolei]RYJ51305.1 DinB family protein [Flavobacterium petrolei]